MQPQRRRHRLLFGLLTFGLLAGAAFTVSPAQAASGAGITFPDRAWNRKLPASTRFFVLTDWASAAVLDKETGLVWERSPALTTHIWAAARFDCTGRTTGNRKGWRLPSMPELASLVDPTVTPGPTLPAGHPFLTVQLAYWSATTVVDDPTDAWYVFFADGTVNFISKTNGIRAWCVRGGLNAEAY